MNARFTHPTGLRGQGLVEYMLLLALGAIVILVALPALNDALQGTFSNVVEGISEAPQWEPVAWNYGTEGGGGGGEEVGAPTQVV